MTYIKIARNALVSLSGSLLAFRKHLLTLVLLPLLLIGCTGKKSGELYQSENIQVRQLTSNTFIHQTYLHTESFGKVSCNGLIFTSGSEAIVLDTPTSDSVSLELIDFLTNHMKLKIKAVIATHFHEDCLGGLKQFHEAGIPSFANELTITFAKQAGNAIPKNGFSHRLISKIGKEDVLSIFPGEGHTRDNIVCYIPSEKVLFGGCLIKALEAGEGYLGDGVTSSWSQTVTQIKTEFADVQYVVPGHGATADATLLDYTIELFSKYHK